MKFSAVVPTIGLSPRLLPLLARLLADGCTDIRLPDNGDDPTHGFDRLLAAADSPAQWIGLLHARETGTIVAYRTDDTIYDSWNEAMDTCAGPLAVLNDDIELPSGSIAEAASHLSAQTPIVGLDYTSESMVARPGPCRFVSGTFKSGGVGGFAFVVDPVYAPRVHPGFRWWYGDDDLMRRVTDTGRRLMIAEGAPVAHPEPSTSGNQMPWLAEACDSDRRLYETLWK